MNVKNFFIPIVVFVLLNVLGCTTGDTGNMPCTQDKLLNNDDILGNWLEIIPDDITYFEYDQWEFDFTQENVLIKIHHFSDVQEAPCNDFSYTEYIKGEYFLSFASLTITGFYTDENFEVINNSTEICYYHTGDFSANFIARITCDDIVKMDLHSNNNVLIDNFEIQRID